MQQELIDSVRKRGRKIRLLWRPVAAALAWCEHHREELLGMGGDAEESLGHIVSLHVGFDCVEATVLEVVSRPDAVTYHASFRHGVGHRENRCVA